ncbi:MAG: lipid-binding SYLF domain-containing protein [Alphaproteobacteria bacterium]
MRSSSRTLAAALLAALLCLTAAPGARAASDAEELVVKSWLLLERWQKDPELASFRRAMSEAKGVLVIPSMFRIGFIVGVRGGSGVLLARDDDGQWSYPAFFTLGGLNVGLQIGVQDSEVIFVILTDAGLNAVIANEIKLGVDASFSIGPIGSGIEGATTTAVGGDIAAYSKSVGIFAGGAFEGAIIRERLSLSAEYYNDGAATARRIVVRGKYVNPTADRLRRILFDFNNPKASAQPPLQTQPPPRPQPPLQTQPPPRPQPQGRPRPLRRQ